MPNGKTRRADKVLTAMFVRAVQKPGKYHDGGGTGLYLRVDPNGARFWVQRITIRGKRCELGLGSPPIVPLAEAREQAINNKRMTRLGGDPLRAKRETSAVPTFAEAARKVHELHKPTWRNAKHAAQFISTLETYTFPRLGGLKIGEVTTSDVLGVLTPMWLEKPETARRVRQRIGMVMKWAIAKGWRQDNPAENVGTALPKQDRTPKRRKSLHYSKVADCIATVHQSNAWPATKLALEFLVLNAARSGEVRMAKWDEIDLNGPEGPEWLIPASRMKMKRDHRVPLSKRAVDVLKEAKCIGEETGFVFPSARNKPLSDMTLSKLVKELGFNVDVHGFRTSFRTWAQEQTNFPREVAELAFAHVIKDKSEAAYARSDLFEKRAKMMNAWAQYMTAKRGEVLKLELAT